jgi:hypothetical protein
MFNLFGKKSGSVKIIDKIWMSETAKQNAIRAEAQKSNEITWIYWFDETGEKIESAIDESLRHNLISARQVTSSQVGNSRVIFLEHYPLREKENQLFEKLKLSKAEIWSALDEPMFKAFGADRVITLMKQMGMKESESVEHEMISKSIRSAQDKFAKKTTLDHGARSQSDWLNRAGTQF